MSGQVAALDGQCVVAHPQYGDAQGKDQGAVRAQAQETCGGRVGLSLVLGDLSPNALACTPGSPGQRGPSPGDCHG